MSKSLVFVRPSVRGSEVVWRVFIVLSFGLAAHAALSPHYSESLVETARSRKLALNPQWLRLGHYKKTLWGKYESQADGADFFLSEQGKHNPEAELIATLNAFFSPNAKGRRTEPAQCQFPARYRWLKQELRFTEEELPSLLCAKFLTFAESLSAKSVSLVFSSYFLNNPASAFGHLLLRFNKKPLSSEGNRHELLDNGVSFAAQPDTENPLLYAIRGLFGGFEGHFSRLPYYYKVREYNDFESRDLWSYDLNLDREQVAMLVAHLWELGSTHFDYYYLDENCAYHTLSLLEAVLPQVSLTDSLSPVTVPTQALRLVNEVPGLVAEITYRPSIRAQFRNRLSLLSLRERAALERIEKEKTLVALNTELSDDEKTRVLDAAMDLVDAQAFQQILAEPNGSAAKWKQKILIARTNLGIVTEGEAVAVPEIEAPHGGHGVARVGVGAGINGDQLFTQVNFRFALHDLLDPRRGFPDNAQIEFFNTRLRLFPRRGEVWLDELNLFHVVSLNPVDVFDTAPSWRVRIGGFTVRDESCAHCLAGQVSGGVGLSRRAGPLLFFALVDADASVAPQFLRAPVQPGIGPSLGVRYSIAERVQMLSTLEYRRRVWTDFPDWVRFEAEARWEFAQDAVLGVRGGRYPDAWEGGMGISYYF